MERCPLCKTRPPRRHCPALSADICAQCCGEERERTIDCPFDCEYLLQAREREPMYELPADYPNQDLRLSEQFLQAHEPLLLLMAGALLVAAGKAGGTDWDLRQALSAMIARRQGNSEEAGPVAAAIIESFEARFMQFREQTAEEKSFDDQDVLRLLAFFQREELQYNNRRPKSRAYLDWLRAYVSSVAAAMAREG